MVHFDESYLELRNLYKFVNMKIRALSFLVLCSVILQAQTNFRAYVSDPGSGAREHNVDIEHMKIEVSFEPQKGLVKGKVWHRFKPLRPDVDTIFWDGPGIRVARVRLIKGKEQTEVKFRTTETGIITYFQPALSWDQKCEILFEYEANPRKGIYFIGWNSPDNTDPINQTRRQIWTQGQGIDNRYWIPMYDQGNDKFTTETVVTFDKSYKVLSNGKNLSCTDNKDGTATWHYLMPAAHAGYLLMLAIDKYEVKKTKTSRGTPVQFWYYPEHPEKVDYTSLHTEKIIEFLEDETGIPYPWGSYSQVMVQDFLYGAMENTSATIFGDFFFTDSRAFLDRNYIGVNAHELTHQWFGDYITARAAEGTWLQESFATYYAKLFFKGLEGDDSYKWNQRGEVQSALAAGQKDNLPIVHSGSGTARVYQKGSAVIQMLRYVLGDEPFKRVIKHYLSAHSFANVETRDLEQTIQDVLGLNLDWFFDQWVYRGGEPHYKVNYYSTSKDVRIHVQQVHEQNTGVGLFKMPVNISVYYTDGTKDRKRVWVEEIYQEIVFPNSQLKKVAFVLFDENQELIKKITFERSYEELAAQLMQAEHMIDRYEALSALDKVSSDLKRTALIQSFERESYWAIKAEIVKQLCSDEKAYGFLRDVVSNHSDHRLRRALITGLKGIPDTFIGFYEKSLSDSSYNNIELAIDKLFLYGKEDQRGKYLEQIKNLTGHNHNLRLKYLELAIIYKVLPETKELEDRLVDYCSNKYEFRTRIAAMSATKKCGIFNESLVKNALDAAAGTNRRLAQPAVDLLKFHAEVALKKELIKQEIKKMNEPSQNWIREAGINW